MEDQQINNREQLQDLQEPKEEGSFDINSERNLSDLMTKALGGKIFYQLVKVLLFRVPSSLEKAKEIA